MTKMRRKDRQLSREESLAFLNESSFGVLAMVDGTKPYGVPLNHFYEDGYLYFHAATVGRKLSVLAKNPEVSYIVSEMQALKPSDNDLLCGFGAYYRSIICTGTAQIIHDESEKACIVTKLTRHLAGGLAGQAPDVTPNQTASVVIIRITVREISGKACLP